MSSSTLYLILKSLLPFIKEILFRDKVIKDLFLENRLASVLSGCLIFVFILVVYMSNVADKAFSEIARLKQANAYLTTTVEELHGRIKDLELERRPRSAGSPLPPPDPVIPITTKAKKSKVSDNLKSYVESRFKNLE